MIFEERNKSLFNLRFFIHIENLIIKKCNNNTCKINFIKKRNNNNDNNNDENVERKW